MNLAIDALFVFFLTVCCIFIVAMIRLMWLESRTAKRTLQIADLTYKATKAKYDALVEAEQKVGGTE